MNTQYNISVFTENEIGLLSRITLIFTRRHVNIESITASESEVENIHRYTIVVSCSFEMVKKLVAQIDKQVEVIKAFYHSNEDIIYQEIALYKLPINLLNTTNGGEAIVRRHNARIISVDEQFVTLEKTGHKEDTQALFNALEPYGILEFARSGRVAITKPMKEFKEYMAEIDFQSKAK